MAFVNELRTARTNRRSRPMSEDSFVTWYRSNTSKTGPPPRDPLRAASANADGRGWGRSLVAELLPPVVRAAFRGEIEEIPERLERADVTRFLIAVRGGVEEL